MQITRLICPTSKYSLKCPDITAKEGIAVHNTANDASAMSEVSYMIGNNNKTSFHVAVDDYRVVEGLPYDRSCYATGDGRYGRGNAHMISIEICYSKSGGERFNKAEKLAAEYISYLLKQYNWGIDKVTKHQDYSSKYCPHRTLDLGWQRFLNMIQVYLNNTVDNTYMDIFDSDLYNLLYDDLQEAYKNNANELYNHFVGCGANEGRIASFVFDIDYYLNKYDDIRQAYYNKKKEALLHFLTIGIKEGRVGSQFFDINVYLNNNKDIKDAFKGDNKEAMLHFVRHGMNEGRVASNEFNVRNYRSNYNDLYEAFKDDWKAYFGHYAVWGRKENRSCV